MRHLPQIRSSLWAANLDVTNGIGHYYTAQFFVFPVLSGVLSVLYFHFQNAFDPGHVLVPVIHLYLAYYLYGLSRTWPSLRSLIRDLYPDLAAALPRDIGNDRDPKAAAWKSRIRGAPRSP
ncbi:hypothetical protein A33M_1658 [Rhodovulum sp. PH10]|nr:hypothetical protein A33M_1658 [Rhodovulum sp. PH10]